MDFGGSLARYAGQPQAEAALFVASAAEGALLPSTTEDLLVPMVLLEESQAFRYALIAAIGSLFGALVAFEVCFLLFQMFGGFLLSVPGVLLPFGLLQSVVVSYAGLLVLAAGFSSAPYKIVTVLCGVMGGSLLAFAVAGFVSRAARFFFIAWVLWRGGPAKQMWLEKAFYGFSTAVSLFLLVGFTFLVFLIQTA